MALGVILLAHAAAVADMSIPAVSCTIPEQQLSQTSPTEIQEQLFTGSRHGGRNRTVSDLGAPQGTWAGQTRADSVSMGIACSV